MPKGITPSARIEQRMTLLKSELDKTPRDYDAFTKIRRKVNEFLNGEGNAQVVTTKKRYEMEEKLKKMERSVRRNVIKGGKKQEP